MEEAQQSAPDIASAARQCTLSDENVQQLFDWFTHSEKAITVYSQGINQSSSGTDKCNAIINCHLASGKIGKPFMGPFSFTGQPNAMGGREAGGLANVLAAHMDLENPQHVDLVSRFWGSDRELLECGYWMWLVHSGIERTVCKTRERIIHLPVDFNMT